MTALTAGYCCCAWRGVGHSHPSLCALACCWLCCQPPADLDGGTGTPASPGRRCSSRSKRASHLLGSGNETPALPGAPPHRFRACRMERQLGACNLQSLLPAAALGSSSTSARRLGVRGQDASDHQTAKRTRCFDATARRGVHTRSRNVSFVKCPTTLCRRLDTPAPPAIPARQGRVAN